MLCYFIFSNTANIHTCLWAQSDDSTVHIICRRSISDIFYIIYRAVAVDALINTLMR